MHHNNIPVGEFYDISVDDQEPYKVYGGTQYDASVFGPAKEWNPKYGDDWQYVWFDVWSGGDGCYTMADPLNSDIIYSSSQNGGIFRKNMRTNVSKGIKTKLQKGHEGNLNHKFVAPYIISKHNLLTLYNAGNYVYKSLNRGDSWKLINPDLSQSASEEKKSVAAGAIAESPIDPGVLFVGIDKGAFWFLWNDGMDWLENSTGLPNGYIPCICPSQFDKVRVYVTVTGINYDVLNN